MSKPTGASRPCAPIRNVVIGTAGHIDHGKTAVIERLTGINADRLPEEKERGMTIDLGFARYTLPGGERVGIVDVPGHERFVKNMVAGASGIDMVLLIVAADDGVMPQTREHLEIMRLLGIAQGVLVLTKVDLVDDDLRALAAEDVRAVVCGTFLEGAPLVPFSAVTGEGLDALSEALHRCIDRVEPRSTQGVFRMPIQRVFSSKGFGTVLTGIPISGRAAAGDTVEVLPLGRRGRVRGVQAYHDAAPVAQAGQSSAVNVSDIAYREVHRGMVLATPGHFRRTSMLEARFQYLASNPRPLRHLTRVRFHCGTAEVIGTLYLLESRSLEPGASAFVQVRLDEEVTVVPGDRFILRLHSPMVTIGGGEVIDLSRWRLKPGKAFVIKGLRVKEDALDDPRGRLLQSIEARGCDAVAVKDLHTGTGLPAEEVERLVEDMLADGDLLPAARSGYVILRSTFEQARGLAHRTAQRFFTENRLRLLMEKIVLRQTVKGHDIFFAELLADLERRGDAHSVRGEFLRWSFHEPRLEAEEATFRSTLLGALEATPFAPPRVDEVAAGAGFARERAEAIAELLCEEETAVRVAPDILLHRQAIESAREKLRAHFATTPAITASEAKGLLGSSRKFVIPLLELFDREGFTLRRGDVRELRRRE